MYQWQGGLRTTAPANILWWHTIWMRMSHCKLRQSANWKLIYQSYVPVANGHNTFSPRYASCTLTHLGKEPCPDQNVNVWKIQNRKTKYCVVKVVNVLHSCMWIKLNIVKWMMVWQMQFTDWRDSWKEMG